MNPFYRILLVITILAFAPMIGCAQLSSAGTSIGTSISNVVAPKTPEAQIVAGANAITAATTLATTLLRNDKITVAQAKAYRTILKGAGDALDDMNATLVACRKFSASTSATNPDPCKPGVIAVIDVALKGIGDVKTALDATK